MVERAACCGKVERTQARHVLHDTRYGLKTHSPEVERGDALQVSEGDLGVVLDVGGGLDCLYELLVGDGFAGSAEQTGIVIPYAIIGIVVCYRCKACKRHCTLNRSQR